MKAQWVHRLGGAEQLRFEETPVPTLGPHDVLVKTEAIGVNFIDIYQRIGIYAMPLPFIPGQEAAGVVQRVGSEVNSTAPGDRVAVAGPQGAYADYMAVPETKLVKLPPHLDSETAAAGLFQGMTAHMLAYGVYSIRAGDRVLVHAAAGGVGLMLVRMAKKLGAVVYGTASTEAKAQIVREAGADVAIVYTKEDFAVRVNALTNGEGEDVIYDAVGKPTFAADLRALRVRGTLVSYGQAGGVMDPVDLMALGQRSHAIVRPSIRHYTASRVEFLERAAFVLGALARRDLAVTIDSRWALAEAAEAQRRLESRETIGKLLLIP